MKCLKEIAKPTLRKSGQHAITIYVPVNLYKQDVIYAIAVSLDSIHPIRNKSDINKFLANFNNLIEIENASHNFDKIDEEEAMEKAQILVDKWFPNWP